MSTITKYMSKNPGTSFPQKKKAPAGMPTHRTGVGVGGGYWGIGGGGIGGKNN